LIEGPLLGIALPLFEHANREMLLVMIDLMGVGLAKPDAVVERTPVLLGLGFVVSSAAFRRGLDVRGDAQTHKAWLAHARTKCRSAATGIRAEPPNALR
jgi:hypothetical protein